MAFGLILVSALIHAVWSALLKRLDDKFAAMQFMSLFTLVCGLPVLFLVPFPEPALWPFIALSIAVHTAYQLLLVAMMKAGDYSLVYPIARGMGPVMVTLFSLATISNGLATIELLAIAATVLGAMIAGLSGHRLDHLPHFKAVLLALMAGFSIGCYTLADGLGVKSAENASSYIAWSIVGFTPFFLALGFALRGPALLSSFARQWRLSLPISILATGGFIIALVAFRLGELAPLAAMRETSILFAAFIGVFGLKERVTLARLVGIILVAAGAITLPLYR